MLASEECAGRALIWAALHREQLAKARHGSQENRAVYRRMADRSESMVGVWMSLEKSTRLEEASR